jgi:hypothetical protein
MVFNFLFLLVGLMLGWVMDLTGVEGLSVIIVLVTASCLLLYLRFPLHELAWFVRWRRRAFPPHSFNHEEWKHRIKEAKANEQKDLLTRTNHQTLGLNAEEFLKVLKYYHR